MVPAANYKRADRGLNFLTGFLHRMSNTMGQAEALPHEPYGRPWSLVEIENDDEFQPDSTDDSTSYNHDPTMHVLEDLPMRGSPQNNLSQAYETQPPQARDTSLLDNPANDSFDPFVALRNMEIRLNTIQAENTRLRARCRDEDSSASWPVLYRVECLSATRVATYVDHPIYIDDGSHLHLEGQRRIGSASAWEQTQRDVPFVVYKSYRCCEKHYHHHGDGRNDINSRPQSIGESVRVLNESLVRAVQHLLNSETGLAIYAQSDVFREQLLRSPYTFFHHFEDEIRRFASRLGHHDSGLNLLLDYINEHSEQNRNAAKEYFSRGEYQDWVIHYLFKPGELLISLSESEPQVVTLRSLLLNVQGDFGSRKLYNCTIGRINFDGNFRRVQQSASLLVEADPSQTHKITNLQIYPLRYSTPQMQSFLLERGRKFYSCRGGRYVSYNADHSAFKGDFVSIPD